VSTRSNNKLTSLNNKEGKMKIQKTVGTSLMSLALVVGLATVGTGVAGATTGSITNTGPDSYNKIKSTSYHSVHTTNNNNLGVSNVNTQSAYTGDAKVIHNTTGGSATSGDAMNANSTSVAATVNNAASAGSWAGAGSMMGGGGSNSASITETGPDSTNKVEFKDVTKVHVTNNNNVTVSNTNTQSATSGDAKVIGNTTGGNATSGGASNTNTTSTSFTLSN
jgi:hypothetical protein